MTDDTEKLRALEARHAVPWKDTEAGKQWYREYRAKKRKRQKKIRDYLDTFIKIFEKHATRVVQAIPANDVDVLIKTIEEYREK